MALLFFDTLQCGTSFPEVGWDANGATGNYSATGGPFNDRYTTIPGNSGTGPARTLGTNAATVVVGFWHRNTVGFPGTSRNIWQFMDGASIQCALGVDVNGKLFVRNGAAGTTHATAAAALVVNVWYFVEIKVVFGNAGSMEVKVDGTQVINATAVDTTTTANNYCTIVQWAIGNVGAWNLGTCHLLDATGAAPENDFLGPTKGYLLSPTGADTGNYNQWTASASTRTSCVDETPAHNTDTDYVLDNTAGHKQSFSLTNTVAGIGTIFGVFSYGVMRRDDAGPHTARLFNRIGGVDYVKTTETLAASYVGYAYMDALSPATGVAWTAAELDGMEAGVELVS